MFQEVSADSGGRGRTLKAALQRERERWFVIKIQRSDTNEVGEYEVTVTSKLHAQAERTKKQNREEEPASSGGAENPEQGIPE